MKKIHFIAMGGSIMHSLAIALQQSGHKVTGSDDQFQDPARYRLAQHNLLPETEGWNPDKITSDLDAVILGMHALADNPELLRAKQLGIKVYSFPEFIYEHSKQKQRIVIAGSYGKTTLTSMIMHVLKGMGKHFDYMVGSQVPGFDNPVRLSEDAPMIVLEGDEYLASKLDPRPKFLLYHPHVILLSGISWDHINVFPTEVEYIQQFGELLAMLPKAGYLIYNENDTTVREMVKPLKDHEQFFIHGYKTPYYKVKDGKYTITLGNQTVLGAITATAGEKQEVSVVGKHNMSNIAGAWKVCEQLGIKLKDFLQHIATFKGAKSRLEVLSEDSKRILIKDFAHAPAKVAATVDAVREMHPRKNLVACLELHTFSSLNKSFVKHYQQTLKGADTKIVFVHQQTLDHKKMTGFTKEEIIAAFGDKTVKYVTHPDELLTLLRHAYTGNDVYLMMSSGNFGGIELSKVGKV